MSFLLAVCGANLLHQTVTQMTTDRKICIKQVIHTVFNSHMGQPIHTMQALLGVLSVMREKTFLKTARFPVPEKMNITSAFYRLQ